MTELLLVLEQGLGRTIKIFSVWIVFCCKISVSCRKRLTETEFLPIMRVGSLLRSRIDPQ